MASFVQIIEPTKFVETIYQGTMWKQLR